MILEVNEMVNLKLPSSACSAQSDLLTVAEAATFLRLRNSTIRAWLLKKKIAYLKLGSRVFLRRRDLLLLLEKSVISAREGVRPPAVPRRVLEGEGTATHEDQK